MARERPKDNVTGYIAYMDSLAAWVWSGSLARRAGRVAGCMPGGWLAWLAVAQGAKCAIPISLLINS